MYFLRRRNTQSIFSCSNNTTLNRNTCDGRINQIHVKLYIKLFSGLRFKINVTIEHENSQFFIFFWLRETLNVFC